MSRSLKAEISWVMGASHFSRHLDGAQETTRERESEENADVIYLYAIKMRWSCARRGPGAASSDSSRAKFFRKVSTQTSPPPPRYPFV